MLGRPTHPVSGRSAPCGGRWDHRSRHDKTHVRAVCLSQSKLLPIPAPPQANASPAKLMQIKMLDFTCFYFSEIGTYQWVTAKKIKIFSSPLRLAAKPRLARRTFGSGQRDNIGCILIFGKWRTEKICAISLSGLLFPPPLRPGPARSRAARQELAEILVDEPSFAASRGARSGSPFWGPAKEKRRRALASGLTRAAGDRRSGGGRRRRRRAR